MIGLAAVAVAIARRVSARTRKLVAVSVIALGLFDLRTAAKRSVFEIWQGERRYPSIARQVARLTPENSLIFSMQHSGTIRYYGGRMTVRYDQIDRDWLDRSVVWLSEQGLESYLLADEWELPSIKQKFAGTRAIAALDAPPVLIYEGGAKAQLFDLTAMGGPPKRHGRVIETYQNLRCVLPAPAPTFALKDARLTP